MNSILKDGKIDKTFVKQGDYIQLCNNHLKDNGIIVIVDENEVIAQVWMHDRLMFYTIYADEIKSGEAKFVISSELSGATIRVNMPNDYDKEFVDSLNWNDSKEDRRSW